MENKNIILLKKRGVCFIDQCATYEEYTRIDVTSGNHNPQIVKDLSPLYIGPVVSSDGLVAKTFENLWQYSKVYPKIYNEDRKIVPGVDINGEPTKDFWAWRKRFFDKEGKGDRHPAFPSTIRHRDCLYAVCLNNGTWEHLDYVQSRKKIYIPEYAKLIVETDTFKELKKRVENGEKIALVDFDAWNYYGPNLDQKTTIKDVVNDPHFKVGHGYVIKMLLQGDLEVVNGKVIDNIGVLK